MPPTKRAIALMGHVVVVVANVCRNPREKFEMGIPATGAWKLHLNTVRTEDRSVLTGDPSADVTAVPGEWDGLAAHAAGNIGLDSVPVFSQVPG